ncbi:MAG: hypothetical protein Kow0075_01740 [Salibacteraceae bacterium]
MRKSNWIATLFILSLFVYNSCSQGGEQEEKPDTTNTEELNDSEAIRSKPAEAMIDPDTLAYMVQQMVIQLAEEQNSKFNAEASQAFDHIYLLLGYLSENNVDKAMDALEVATGKLEIALAKNPDLALVPINVSMETIDLVADIETVREVKEAVKKALKDGHFQIVRDEAAKLASEIQITTVNMPLAAFPEVLKTCAVLLDNGKVEETKVLLYTSLNALTIEEVRIPLPILRAQAMIAKAAELAEKEGNEQAVLNLLENAAYQVSLAEELGYGQKDEEFEALQDSIDELKKEVKQGRQSFELFSRLKKRLKTFREKIST